MLLHRSVVCRARPVHGLTDGVGAARAALRGRTRGRSGRSRRTQSDSGSWDEPYCTGTAAPDFVALHYGLYGHVFPLTALGRYVRRQDNGAGSR